MNFVIIIVYYATGGSKIDIYITTYINKKLSYRRETARQLCMST